MKGLCAAGITLAARTIAERSTRRMNTIPRAFVLGTCLAALAVLSGCTSVGPRTIQGDRFDYGTSVQKSFEEQLLLNMVGLRYGRAPSFIEVSSIINSYSLEGSVSAGGGLNSSISGSNTASIGGASRWAGKPTITYVPTRGRTFTQNLLTPIPPASLYGLFQSGWPADLVFGLGANAINGIENSNGGNVSRRQVDPLFYEVCQAMDRVNRSRALGVRQVTREDGTSYLIVFPSREELDTEVVDAIGFLQETLGLGKGTEEFELVYGAHSRADNEIALLSSSILDMMIKMSAYFEIPPEHIADGRATPTADYRTLPANAPYINVRYSPEEPEDAVVKVRRRDTWFYIDDKDFASKRTFAVLLIFLSLAETGQNEGGPALTISQ